MNGLKFGEEPPIDIRHLPDLIHCVTLMERRSESKNTLVRRVCELLIDILNEVILSNTSATTSRARRQISYLAEARKLIVNGSDSFLDRLFESATNAHHLTNTLHAAAQQPTNPTELLQIPAWNLDHDVVQAGLETRTCDFGHRILDLVEWDTQAELRCNEGEGITRCFGSKCRGTRQPGINLVVD